MLGPNEFADMYDQYHNKIKRLLSLKVDVQTAEDITQLTFIKAMENYHSFRGDSSLFTWLWSIANNTLKNEYRRKQRGQETNGNLYMINNRFISVEFTKNVEIRIDVSKALEKLNMLDREIITLHYLFGFSIREVSEIVNLRISAVKNRLYRALHRLRLELEDREVREIMSIIDYISVVSKIDAHSKNKDQQMYKDILDQLKDNVERISTLVGHQPSRRVTIEIYHDLHSFHKAVGEPDAPNWFMGVIEGDTIKIASPLNPGPEHTYQSILQSTVHLYTMWLVKDLNPVAPKWLSQGLGGYEAGLMTKEYVKDSIMELVKKGQIPSLEDLDNNTWEFEEIKGFQFSYTLSEFVLQQYGSDRLIKFIKNPIDFEGAFHCSGKEFHKKWCQELSKRYG